DRGRREVDELARVVLRNVRDELLRELLDLRALAAHPARGGDVDRLELTLDAVLVAQPISRDFELERADGAQDQIVAEQRAEELRRALLAQLREALLQRLELQRVLEHRAPEQLGREARNPGESERLALREAVADVDRAVVVQADDVARVSFVDVLTV